MTDEKIGKLVNRLYKNFWGRRIVNVIIRPWISIIAGHFMDTACSKLLIQQFIRKNNIDMNQYEQACYKSFNDFFIRRIKPSGRTVCANYNDLIAPCNGLLTVHNVDRGLFKIKGLYYDIEDLLRNKALADKYEGGTIMLLRLTVSDYHRYHFPDSGIISEKVRIDGLLHTVNPEAAKRRSIYVENTREFNIIQSDNFGDILFMQVGALFVGGIKNLYENCSVRKGDEAGWFHFGGSTVIMLMERGVMELLPEYCSKSNENKEIKVHMGQIIGRAKYE